MTRPLRAAVTQTEVQAARELLQDYGLVRPSLAAALAAALADAREGATIPGVRHDVGRTTDVRLWDGHPARLGRRVHLEQLRERLRADWARGLEASRLRPLGWPPVTTSWLRFRPLDLYEYGQPRPVKDWPPMVECDEDQADLLRLSIRGQAVAL